MFCYYYLKMTGISAGVAEAIACFGDLYCVQTQEDVAKSDYVGDHPVGP